MKDSIEKMGNQPEPVTVVTDGAYSEEANEALARENNITLVPTNLTGRECFLSSTFPRKNRLNSLFSSWEIPCV